MLASRDRVRPCRLRLKPSSSGRSTRAVPSSTTIRMLACMAWVRDPRGPFTVTTLSPPTATSTPPGNAMGCFPILLIVPLVPRPSPHVREYFAADTVARRVLVRHHAMGRADDGDPEPPSHGAGRHVRGGSGRPGFDTRRRPVMVRCLRGPYFRPDPEQLVHTLPFAFVPVDEPFVRKGCASTAFESLDVGATSSSLYAVLALRILGQQVRRPGPETFEENFVFFAVVVVLVLVVDALTMRPRHPRSFPRCASSRKQIRHRRYRL